MEDKKINEQESLALIQDMLKQTRRNVVKGGAFLWIGYPLAIGLIILGIINMIFRHEYCIYATWGFMAAMVIFSYLSFRQGWLSFGDKSGLVSYPEKILNGIWKAALSVISVILFMFLFGFYTLSTLPVLMVIIMVVLIMACLVSNILLEDKAFKSVELVSGFLAGFILLFVNDLNNDLYSCMSKACIFFSIAVIPLLIIPGYKLRNRAKKEECASAARNA